MSDEAFTEFAMRTWPHLDRVARTLTGSRHDADDLLQNTYTKAYKMWPKLAQMAHPEAYLRRILINESTSSWRLRWRHKERPTESPPDATTGPPQDRYATHDAIWRSIQGLPKRQRAVLVLRYYEDLSEKQTAEVLGVTTGTVKSQCKHALDKLRDALDDEALSSKAGNL